ncbi:MAG: flagellar motor protein MotB [Bacteroidia bacterium]
MKTTKRLLILLIPVVLFSCVSSKKYKVLSAQYKKAEETEKNCGDELKKAQADNIAMTKERAALQAQVDYLKKNNNQVLGALQDMSVLSSKQAESVKTSLESMSKKDAYIMNLQSAIQRKDSLNLILVTNLKSSLKDVNDKDINIKVEKGVVYVDISDKLLFNSGQYAVTENAKTVLGKVANVLNAHPDIEIIVEGHTDNVPIHTGCLEDNWDLSVKRATSVVRILENQYKISPSRMTAAGHSKYVQVASNDSKEGKALNRRTRIIILPQLDQFFKLMTK